MASSPRWLILIAVIVVMGLVFLWHRNPRYLGAHPRQDSVRRSFAPKEGKRTIEARLKALNVQRAVALSGNPPGADDGRFQLFKSQFKLWLKQASPKGFSISDDEAETLAKQVFAFLQVSGQLKIDAAVVHEAGTGSLSIEIPAQPDLAVAEWGVFNDHLAAALTKSEADRIDDAIGWRLAGFFEGYGNADEKIELVPVPSTPGLYNFSYSAAVPTAQQGDARLITGRWLGSNESRVTTLADLFADPQYAHLRGVLGKSK